MFLFFIRLRQDLAEVSNRNEQTVKEMRNEVAEMKALLIRVLQNGSVPSLPSLPPIRSLQPPSPQQLQSTPNETRPASKRSASTRSHRRKHRRQLNFRSDDEDGEENYQGLPLTDEAELPSVRVLAMRAQSHRKQNRDDQDLS